MTRYLIIAAMLVSTGAQALPASKKDIEEAVKREQHIKDLAAAPASAFNICRRC